jgi:hypothetical protein
VRTAVYDMASSPATFDCVPWACAAAAMAGDSLRIIVLADRFRDTSPKDKALSLADKRARVERIILPCCRLLPGATVGLAIDRTEAESWRRRSDVLRPSTFVTDCNRQHAAGREVRRLSSPVRSEFDGAVVITIRQTRVMPAKNSNMDAWLGAASRIQAAGHRVVLIPDTEMVGKPPPAGYEWCPEAAQCVFLRAGMYQNAAVSLGRGVGPMAIAMFMPATRYVCFVDHGIPGDRAVFERVFGVRWGQQLPFAGRGQALDFRPDTEDAILDAFREATA